MNLKKGNKMNNKIITEHDTTVIKDEKLSVIEVPKYYLLSIQQDGKHFSLRVEGNNLIGEGDLTPNKAAKILFEQLELMFADRKFKW